MITDNNRQLDAEDAAVLFYAICKFVDKHGEAFDLSMPCIGYAEAMERARLAAGLIAAAHTHEGDDWDGVVWFERLEKYGRKSLAAELAKFDFIAAEAHEALRSVVLDWLARVEG